MKYRSLQRATYICTIFLTLASASVHAALLVIGNQTDNVNTFNTQVSTAVFDLPTATFYTALATTGGQTFSLAKAIHQAAFEDRTAFTPIATNSPLTNAAIEQLTLATSYANLNPNLALVLLNGTTPQTQTAVTIASNTGTIVTTSSALDDATIPTPGTTSGIVAIAANASFIFAAVRPTATAVSTQFPALGSGIALVQIVSPQLELEIKDATTGLAGNKAAPYDVTQASVTTGGATPPIPAPTGGANAASLFWDDQLQRLYLGLRLQTAPGVGNGAKAVAVAMLNPSNALVINSFLPNAALTATGDSNHIVAAVSSGVAVFNTEAITLKTMHTSIGPTYLIVQGGSFGAPTTSVTNTLYALPLVDLGDPTNVNQGVLANKNSFNAVTHRFETPAAASGDLTTNTDPAAVIGASSLPIDQNHTISGMQVVGDCVYVSLSNSPDASNNDTGIFSSQALFDQQGKIIRWSPWTKRVIPMTNFSSALEGAFAFAVDPASASVWAVDGATRQIVRVTTWQTNSGGTDLVSMLNTDLFSGSFSFLDLDQSTQGFFGTNAPSSRYALFGGSNKVAFTLISQATQTPNSPINSPQTVTTDFSQPQNYRLTYLPGHAGAVTSLEYTRQVPGTASNYFFAGTDQGLYVFASNTGNGFDAATLGALNAAPFSTGTWQQVAAITGPIVDIKTIGNRLYILAFAPTTTSPLNTVLYSVPITTNVSTMFASPTIVAQTLTAPLFTTTALFTGVRIISTNPTGTTEQLVLATNTGLYQTTIVGGTQAGATQATAGWTLIDPSFYTKLTSPDSVSHVQIASADVTSLSTLWPISLQDQGLKTFERSSIGQLAGTADSIPFSFVPLVFNSIDVNNSNFTTLPRLTSFWTDGARRLFITTRIHGNHIKSALMSFPFDTIESNIALPEAQIITHPVLNEVTRFYWTSTVGASGLLLVGTDSGVVALM